MKKLLLVIAVLLPFLAVQASWYWPFGDDDEEEEALEQPKEEAEKEEEEEDEDEPPRLSKLMAPASELIDEASDLAAEGKTNEAVEKYRKALDELNRVEKENPDRVKKPEFATLRNKRAYIEAAIDSLMLSQVRDNARAVAVSDTTEMEKRYAAEKRKRAGMEDSEGESSEPDEAVEEADERPQPKQLKKWAKSKSAKPIRKSAAKVKKVNPPAEPKTPREQAIAFIASGDYAAADRVIAKMLKEKPNSAAALNLKAVSEWRQGRKRDAEATLDQAIMSNPRNPAAYYNMAWLMLEKNNRSGAARFYETGRAMGGAEDQTLEAQLK